MTPMFFAGHKDMVHPERREGAKAVDGLFRFSHFRIGMRKAELDEGFKSASVGILSLG